MRNIAIIGKMRSGKGEIAKAIKEIDPTYTEIAFADPLKAEVVRLMNNSLEEFGIQHQITRNTIENDKGVFRPFLQWLGTEFYRQYMDRGNHWVDQFSARVAGLNSVGKNVIVSDVRFPNEIEAVRSKGFTVIKVTRDETERLRSIRNSGGTLADSDHVSETYIDTLPFDIEIKNNKSLADMRYEAEQVTRLIDLVAYRK